MNVGLAASGAGLLILLPLSFVEAQLGKLFVDKFIGSACEP